MTLFKKIVISVFCYAPKPLALYFQDSASSQMEAAIGLHDNIMFKEPLVILLFGFLLIMVSIIRNYAYIKYPISNSKGNSIMPTLIELYVDFCSTLLYIWFPLFKLLSLIVIYYNILLDNYMLISLSACLSIVLRLTYFLCEAHVEKNPIFLYINNYVIRYMYKFYRIYIIISGIFTLYFMFDSTFVLYMQANNNESADIANMSNRELERLASTLENRTHGLCRTVELWDSEGRSNTNAFILKVQHIVNLEKQRAEALQLLQSRDGVDRYTTPYPSRAEELVRNILNNRPLTRNR